MKHLILHSLMHTFNVVLTLILVGCASTPTASLLSKDQASAVIPSSELPAPGRATTNANDAPPKSANVDVSPLHNSRESWTGPTAEGASFAGTYTRLVIKSTFMDSAGEAEASDNRYKMPYLKRSLIARAIAGKDFNVVATAKMRISNVLDISVPLAIIGHTSNSDGENWIREVYFERRDFPLFLVKRTGEASTPSVTAEIKGTSV